MPAADVDRIIKTGVKSLQVVDADKNELFSAADIDSVTFLAPMPQADLFNVVFHEDGTAEDVSPMKFDVEAGGGPKTEWSDEFNRYVAKISGNDWGNSNVTKMFYRFDYTNNTKFKNAIADGHTLEVLFKPDYSGTLLNREAKIFASHEQGGTGIMVKRTENGPNNKNTLTFLPNVSKTTTSTWRWCASEVIPVPDEYYHIVGVWNKDEKKAYIYVNGELQNELTLDGSNYKAAIAGATSFCIGGDATKVSSTKTTGVQNGINGTIVLARIYDDPLDAEQATRLYQDVENGILSTKPIVEKTTLLENVMVKAGANYPVFGEGFENGDVITLTNGSYSKDLPATLKGDEGVTLTLPADITTGEYTVTLNRGERTQKLGNVNFTLSDKFDVNTEVVAHRGYWATEGAAQNSRAALQNAIDLKCYGAETDVWLTTDNRLVVNHDSSIGGVKIQDSTYDAVKDKTLSNGETVPTLEDLLEILKGSDRCKLIIEIKTHSQAGRTIEAAMAAVEAVKTAGLEDMVEYIAFDYATCEALAKLSPKVTVQYLCDSASKVKTPQQLKDAGDINVDYKYTIYNSNPSFVADAKNLGLTVNVWTVTTSAMIGEWIINGADFITGDAPDITTRYLNYYKENK